MNSPVADTKLLSITEASRVLGVSQSTVIRWIKSNAIPHYRINNRTRINVADLLKSTRVEAEVELN